MYNGLIHEHHNVCRSTTKSSYCISPTGHGKTRNLLGQKYKIEHFHTESTKPATELCRLQLRQKRMQRGNQCRWEMRAKRFSGFNHYSFLLGPVNE